MATTKPQSSPDRGDTAANAADAFREAFGEELRQALDIDTWHTGWDPAHEWARIEGEVREVVAREDEHQRLTRSRLFPMLFDPEAGVPGGGVYDADRDVLRLIQRGLLFNGGVEACDGTVHVHDTLPLTIYQVGVSLVSYRGDRGTWHHRLFRRDLRQRGGDPLEETFEELERRSRRSALNHDSPADQLGGLARKALMDYAERAILLHRSPAVWRLGHGNPVTYELLTGAGIREVMAAGLDVLRGLIEGHRKFVFVASEPRERMLLTLGQALRPLQYAIVSRLDDRLRGWFHQRRFIAEGDGELSWDGERLSAAAWIPRFLERVASQVVVGLYRATRTAPAQLFYAHADHAHLAAHLVLANSVFQEHRGFPLLTDLAHHVCRAVFGGSLQALTESAYAAAGAPWRYFSERMTRAD
jgi:hypothetical protein